MLKTPNLCHAMVPDRTQPKQRWSWCRVPCRYRWQQMRLDESCRPRLLCGIHAKQQEIKWSDDAAIDLNYLTDAELAWLLDLCTLGVKHLQRCRQDAIDRYTAQIERASERLEEVRKRRKELGL